jgi:pimeloyl-ACP methyl ester carboxylesterase
MATFVLVHGAFHGAWCWYKVIARLEAHGHKVIAPDLPGHGRVISSAEPPTLQDYVNHIAGVVDKCGERVVLVGHSMGGMVISATAEAVPTKVAKLVYLCAYMPINGDSMAGMMMLGGEPSALVSFTVPTADGKAFTLRDEGLRPIVYGDCSDEDVALAKLLIVPQSAAPTMAAMELTEQRYGRVPRAYIECSEDKTVSPDLQRAFIARAPCAQVHRLKSSHSPFFSVPDQLVAVLDELAR